MLTATQINKIGRAKAAGRGVDLRLSKTQLSKQGGFGPFAGSMLAGIAAPMIGKMLGFGQGGRGFTFLELVGGYSFLALVVGFSFLKLQFLALVVGFNSLDKTNLVEGKKERQNSVGSSSSVLKS